MFSLDRDGDTICAVATAPGVGGIAVLRLSGKDSLKIISKVCSFIPSNPESHRVYYGFFKSSQSQEEIDEVLVSYFKAGRSFTNEETFEISCHGGSVVSRSILESLIEAGARLAEPGEFTYRAFMNGRIDLVQAESVLQLIESDSKKSARLSLRQLKGELSVELLEIEELLTITLAHLEANIDFAAEDIQIESNDESLSRVRLAMDKTDVLLSSYREGRLIQSGLKIALVGEPNVGKSSLLNALTAEEKAIVTDVPGTTRDFVENQISVNGLRVQFIDTAGLRETQDRVEKIGIDRTYSLLGDVDYTFLVVDLNQPQWIDDLPTEQAPLVVVANKSDLAGDLNEKKRELLELLSQKNVNPETPVFVVCAQKPESLGPIHEYLLQITQNESAEHSATISQARHYELLQSCRQNMQHAWNHLENSESPDIVALDLQQSLKDLFEVLGKRFDDEVMDRVFKEFCLGK
ncbi:MAG: tRNA uridine-5-carboxymethylaminomethyl(34) synthesis GTPase MnmE [Bdellovibrionaceae bacterium]|nr:tRNA uridine-5-carboxymethylaminomethyl(34) synthesis GTPase MnmE [Pseudobdellovibrionaceae bacterium]|tara:strand:+ start:131520 stop:132911 length:1392 start_codon:yes stop_codon:yes gene_type:complete